MNRPSGRYDASTEVPAPLLLSSGAGPFRLGPYELRAELARGGAGIVYRAVHAGLGREVALKVLLAGDLASAQQRERFRLEAQATARLRHPHIVAVHDVGEEGGLPYLAMDLIEGESLAERLERDGPLPERTAAELCAKLAGALQFAHERLILHRDVKPANVLLDRAGEPLLSDFGLAKVLDGGEGGPTLSGQLLGTPAYMPPEQLNQALVDARSDVYALGITLYELLTGTLPFVGDTTLDVIAQHVQQDPTPPSEHRPGLARDLETICLKCLEKDPDQRYPTARALGEDLERFVRDEPIAARRPGLLDRLRRWRRRHPRALAGAAVLAAGVLAYAAFRPAWLLLDLSRCPAGTQVFLNGDLLEPPEGGAPHTTTWVWPGEAGLEARAPAHEVAALRLRLESGETRTWAPDLRRHLGALSIVSAEGALDARLTPAGSDAASLTSAVELAAPVYGRELPTGRYRLELTRPGSFPAVQALELRRGAASRVEAELEALAIWDERRPSASLSDVAVLDVDLDGRFELVLLTRETLSVLDLATSRLRWHRPLQSGNRLASGILAADLDGDGGLELVLHDGTQVLSFDAVTGDVEAAFDRFASRLLLLDGDGDGRAEVVCGTPYRGVQCFRPDGTRLWGRATPDYANRALLAVPLPGGPGIALVTGRRAPQLFLLDAATGEVRWRQGLLARPHPLVLLDDGSEPLLVFQGAAGLRALEATDGAPRWSRGDIPQLHTLRAGRFDPARPPALVGHADDELVCLDAQGELRWRAAGRALGAGNFGDVDGDGRAEYVALLAAGEGTSPVLCAWDEAGDRTFARPLAANAAPDARAGFAPIVCDAFEDGRPVVLLAGRQRLSLLKLAPERPLVRSEPRRSWIVARDLDGDGRAERLRADLEGLSCAGSVAWSRVHPPEASATLPARPTSEQFGDVDGDGCLDLALAVDRHLWVVSGRDGRTLRRESFATRPQQAPLCGPRGPVVWLGREELVVVGPGREPRRLPWAHARLDLRAAFVEGSPPTLVHGEPRARRGSRGQAQLVRRSLVDGRVLWRRELEEIPRGRLVVAAGAVFTVGAQDSLYRTRLTDGAVLRTLAHVLPAGIARVLPRRGPHGDELLLVGAKQGLVSLDPRTGATLHTLAAPDLADMGSWDATCADLDGDGAEEVVVGTSRRYLLVLDGATLARRLSSARYCLPLLDEDAERSGLPPPQVSDLDGDGALDLLLSGPAPCVLRDLPAHLRWAARPRVGTDPRLELGYLARDLIQGRRARARERVLALETTPLGACALGLALEHDVEAGRRAGALAHLRRLVRALRGGEPLEPFLAHTGAVCAPVLEGVHRSFLRLELEPAERQVLRAHLRAALVEYPSAARELLAKARRRRDAGDGQAERQLLELSAALFPRQPEVRARFNEATERLALRRHRAYERAVPIRLLERALERCETTRLHALLGAILRVRLPAEVERAAAHFDRAVELGREVTDPDLTWALQRRALFFLERQRLQEAARDLLAASGLQSEPDGCTLAVAGLLAAAQGHAEAAREHLAKALELGVQDPLNLGETAAFRYVQVLQTRPIDEALAAYAALRRLRGPQGRDLAQSLALGEQLALAGRYPEALPLLAEAAQLAEGGLRARARELHRAARDAAFASGWRR